MNGNSAYQKHRQLIGGKFAQPGAQLLRHADADLVVGHPPVEDPVAGLRHRDNLTQEVMKFVDFNPAIGHFHAKVGMIGSGFLHPENIIVEQRIGVCGR